MKNTTSIPKFKNENDNKDNVYKLKSHGRNKKCSDQHILY